MTFSDQTTRHLKGKLNGAHVRTREWQGKTLSYIEGWHAISEANRIFGFDAWDRHTASLKCVSEIPGRERSSCAYLAKVRITVRAGPHKVVREGTGAGHAAGATIAEAHALAAKEAETDATKRALSTFGNPFGLALYDREQKGVRRSKTGQPKPRVWVILDSDGAISGQFTDAEACARALRQKLEQAVTVLDLTDLWRANKALIHDLGRFLGQTDASVGSDIDLASTYAGRYARLWAKQTLSPRDDVVATDEPLPVDKSQLALPAPKRIRAPEHLKWVAALGCTVCQRQPADAHHLKRVQPNAMAKKPGDQWVVPLCRIHHRALHDAGDETRWWQDQKIDPVALANELWANSNGLIVRPVTLQHQISTSD